MVFSSTREKRFWFILGLSTFLALVGFSVSIWSIGSLKYQIEYSNDVLFNLKSNQQVFRKSISHLNLTVKKLEG